MMFSTFLETGKVVVYDRATGQRLERWPVDARELLATGGFTAAILWEILRHFLVKYFTTAYFVNTIYGSMATTVIVLLTLEAAALIVLLGAQYLRAQQGNIEFSAKERLGVAYAQAALPLLQHWLQPQPNADQTRQLLDRLAKVEAELGSELGTQQAYGKMQSASGQGPAVGPLLDLLGAATDGSNLTLDPDIDTYYLMDAALFRLPFMAQSAALVADAGPQQQRIALEQAMLIRSNLLALEAGIAKSVAYNASVGPAVKLDQAQAVFGK
jgi:hypothetical protein